jgi:hypothetical protein
MSWLDLSGKIDAFKRELDGIDEAISHAMQERAALQAWNVSKRSAQLLLFSLKCCRNARVCVHAIACALKISLSISQYLQAQAQQLAAERSTLAKEQKQLATDLCHLEAQVQSHQLVTEARAKRDANHAATVQQLQVRILSIRIRAQRMQHERFIGTCTACVLPFWLVKAQADIARAREQLRQDAQAFLSDTAAFQAKYSLDALEERKVAIQADLVSCTAEREAADNEYSRIHAAQQVQYQELFILTCRKAACELHAYACSPCILVCMCRPCSGGCQKDRLRFDSYGMLWKVCRQFHCLWCCLYYCKKAAVD